MCSSATKPQPTRPILIFAIARVPKSSSGTSQRETGTHPLVAKHRADASHLDLINSIGAGRSRALACQWPAPALAAGVETWRPVPVTPAALRLGIRLE